MTDRSIQALFDATTATIHDVPNRDRTHPDGVTDASPEAAAAVAQGTLLLSLLSQRAAAARAEAQCTELRLFLGEARSGDPRRLQHWLQSHAAEHSLSTTRSHLESSRATTSSTAIRPAVTSSAITRPDITSPDIANTRQSFSLENWNQLLAPARNRLVEHARRLSTATRSKELRGASHDKQPTTNHNADAITKIFAADRRQAGRAEHARSQVFSRLRGMLTSIVAHIVLVLLLGWITLRLPSPPASLALDASPTEWTSEAMEVSQPLEVERPSLPNDSSHTEESFDVSETFADVSANVSSAIGQLAAPPSSLLSASGMSSSGSNVQQLLQNNAIFFGAAASGNCFCYVIDGSGSMRNGPWDAAKLELLKSLATLKEKQRFYIIFFNRELNAIPLPGERSPAPTALYATEENLLHTRRWLDSLRIDIGAPPNDALAMAIDKEPDAIYLLTDGVTNADVPKFLRDKNRVTDLIDGEQVRVPIHTIAFCSLDGQDLLKKIAKENRGEFIYVPDPRRPRVK